MKSLKINALASIIVRVLNIICPLITGPYILRILAKENLAIFDSANSIASFFVPLATLGIYTYGMRSVSKVRNKKNERNVVFSELFYISIFSTFFTALIYYIYIFNFIKYTSNIQFYIYIILGFQIISQFLYIEWVNEALENYTFILYKTIFLRLFMITMIFSYIKKVDDIIPYTLIMVFSEILNLLISFVWIKKDIKLVKVNIKKTLKLLIPLFTMVLLSNINMLYTYLDRLFLTKSPVSTNISDYVVGFNIVMLIISVISGAISVNIPRLSFYLGEKDYNSYNDLLNKGSRIFLFFTIPISFGLMIIGTETTLIYGGNKFLTAGIVTSIFAIRSIIWTLDNILGIQIIFIKGYEKNLTIFITIGGIINLILNYILYKLNLFLPQYFVITTIIAETIVVITYIIFITKNNIASLKSIFKYTFKYTLVASSFIIISIILNCIFPYEKIFSLKLIFMTFVKIIICSLTYIFILYLQKDTIINLVLVFIKTKIKKPL